MATIVDLSRQATASPGDTEQTLSAMLPTTALSCVFVQFGFRSEGPDVTAPQVARLMPLADVAIRVFWDTGVASIAPLLGKVGYLQELGEKAGYIGLISVSLRKITERMGMEKTDFTRELWRVLVDNLKRKERVRLKSLVEGEGEGHGARGPDPGDPVLFEERRGEDQETGSDSDDLLLWEEGELGLWESESEDDDLIMLWDDGREDGEDEDDDLFIILDDEKAVGDSSGYLLRVESGELDLVRGIVENQSGEETWLGDIPIIL